MQFLVIVASFLFVANGHMGISSVTPSGTPVLKPREFPKVGDSYRNPNSGHCHGVPPGTPYPQKVFAAGDELKFLMSGGAAHGGGQCALFLADPKDSESVWYKQMDVVDCSLMGTTPFSWSIEARNVPEFCSDGCTIIWVWSPIFSGTCEIYVNCFDVKITGGTAVLSSLINLKKDDVYGGCVRPDSTTHQTSTFGTFCGPGTGAQFKTSYPCVTSAAPEATNAPTSAPAPTATPVTPTSIGYRCGDGWIDANNKCLSACTVANESMACAENHMCFADLTRSCKPTQTNTKKLACKAIGVWSAYPGMDAWCEANKETEVSDFASHCDCNVADSDAAGYGGDTRGDFTPHCQKDTADGKKTFKTISDQYDLASYVLGSDLEAAKEIAANNLLNYNRQCNNALKGLTIDSPILKDTVIYITGDCQLTDNCLPLLGSDSESGVMRMAPSSILMTLAILFACVL